VGAQSQLPAANGRRGSCLGPSADQRGPRHGQPSSPAVRLLDGVGDDDGRIRRLSRVRTGHVGLWSRLGVLVRRPGLRVPGARLLGRGGVGVWLAGGVYNWVREGVSAYVAGTLAYVIDPSLAANDVYNAVVIIVLFWGGVLVSSRGVGIVAKLSSSGTLTGTLIPGAILVALGIAYLLQETTRLPR
jgi:hypothetical protein